MACGVFGGDLALVDCFVGQHRLTYHVADGEDRRDVGAHLFVGRNEAPLVDDDAGVLGADQASVGLAADGDQNSIEVSVFGAAAPSKWTTSPFG